jgi:hypothetical protein
MGAKAWPGFLRISLWKRSISADVTCFDVGFSCISEKKYANLQEKNDFQNIVFAGFQLGTAAILHWAFHKFGICTIYNSLRLKTKLISENSCS